MNVLKHILFLRPETKMHTENKLHKITFTVTIIIHVIFYLFYNISHNHRKKMKIFVLFSTFSLATSIRCAIFSTTSIVRDVSRTCTDNTDVIHAGSGDATPCIHDCGQDVEFCALATNRDTGLNTGRCGETYMDVFGTCTDNVCICVTDKEVDNLGECSSASHLTTTFFGVLVVFFLSAFLMN